MWERELDVDFVVFYVPEMCNKLVCSGFLCVQLTPWASTGSGHVIHSLDILSTQFDFPWFGLRINSKRIRDTTYFGNAFIRMCKARAPEGQIGEGREGRGNAEKHGGVYVRDDAREVVLHKKRVSNILECWAEP